MKLRDTLPLLKETFTDWGKDKAPRLAAALSYYTLFSIAPLVIIVIAIVGIFFGKEAASGQIAAQIRNTVGQQAAEAIQGIVANAGAKPSHGIAATVLGIATLLLGAAGVFGQLQDALNTIWGVAPKPGRGFLGMVKDRFLSLTMVAGVGFLLLVSLVVSAALAAVTHFVGDLLPGLTWLGPLLDLVLSVGVFTVLLAMIFKVLPDARIAWRDVWTGAALTALLFAIGKALIGLYLGKSSVGSAYGAAGSLVVLLLWVYYASQVLFFGAEFTKVYARKFGSRIEPAENAVAVTEEARAEQGMSSGQPAPQPEGRPRPELARVEGEPAPRGARGRP
jgi:membrane protein